MSAEAHYSRWLLSLEEGEFAAHENAVRSWLLEHRGEQDSPGWKLRRASLRQVLAVAQLREHRAALRALFEAEGVADVLDADEVLDAMRALMALQRDLGSEDPAAVLKGAYEIALRRSLDRRVHERKAA